MAKMTVGTKSWTDMWRMTSRIKLRKLAWNVYILSPAPSIGEENRTLKLSFCLLVTKWRPQWLHKAARHLRHEILTTPWDLFIRESWIWKEEFHYHEAERFMLICLRETNTWAVFRHLPPLHTWNNWISLTLIPGEHHSPLPCSCSVK